jgi:hypothetical protein
MACTNPLHKLEQRIGEELRPLQWRNMAHPWQLDQFGGRDTHSQITGVLGLDELIMLALHNRNRHMDLAEISSAVVRLALLHLADRRHQRIKLPRGRRDLLLLSAMPLKTTPDNGSEFELFGITRIYITGEEDLRNSLGVLIGRDQRSTCPVALPSQHNPFKLELIEHCHQITGQ